MKRIAIIASVIVVLAALAYFCICSFSTSENGSKEAPALLTDLPSRYAQMDSTQIHYRAWGEENDTAMVFVHGFGCDSRTWQQQYAFLADSTRCKLLFVDLPGYGMSAKPHTDYTLSYLASAVHTVLLQEGIRQAVVIGHSLGTPVCRELALEYPQLVAALMDIDGVYCFYQDASPEYIKALEQFTSMFEGADCQQNIMAFVDALSGPDTPEEITDYAMSTMPLTPDYVAASTMHHLIDSAYWTGEPIGCPTAVICSENSGLEPDNAERMAALYLNMVDYIQLVTCGHFIHMEQPEIVNAAIQKLMEAI